MAWRFGPPTDLRKPSAWGSVSGSELAPVTVDDAALFLGKVEGGVAASFEVTRFAAGRRNHNAIEVNGSKGSVAFNMERMNELEYYNREDPPEVRGFRTILATEPGYHAYIANWWPPGHIIGYEHTFIHQAADFPTDDPPTPFPRQDTSDPWSQ